MSSEPAKKARKVGSPSENSNTADLDAATQRNLEAVDVCQIEIDNINAKASEEIMKIEQKYNLQRKPLFQKRSEIIRNIPNFWFTAIMNHPDLSTIIDGREEECLQFLERIEVEEFDDIRSGYKIEFHFEENPFFENAFLTKEFNLQTVSAGAPNSQSTLIKWKEGNDLTRTNENAGKSGRKRRAENKTFFGWFTDNVDPISDDIAEIFKDDLWQNPLQYYLVPDMEETNGAENDDDSDSSDVEEVLTEDQ